MPKIDCSFGCDQVNYVSAHDNESLFDIIMLKVKSPLHENLLKHPEAGVVKFVLYSSFVCHWFNSMSTIMALEYLTHTKQWSE